MFLAGYKNISRIRYQQPKLGIKSQIKRSTMKIYAAYASRKRFLQPTKDQAIDHSRNKVFKSRSLDLNTNFTEKTKNKFAIYDLIRLDQEEVRPCCRSRFKVVCRQENATLASPIPFCVYDISSGKSIHFKIPMQAPTSAVQIRSVPLPTFNVAYLVTRNDFRSGNGDLLQQSLESPRHQWTYMDLTSVDPK